MSLQQQFAKQFKRFIHAYGVTVRFPVEGTDCPNCGWSFVTKASNGKYNTNNSYAMGSEYNRPFHQGEICPVCGGKGKITTYQDVTTIVNWGVSDYYQRQQYEQDDKIVRLKIYKTDYDHLMASDTALIPSINDKYLKCKRASSPTPFGVGRDMFVKVDYKVIE